MNTVSTLKKKFRSVGVKKEVVINRDVENLDFSEESKEFANQMLSENPEIPLETTKKNPQQKTNSNTERLKQLLKPADTDSLDDLPDEKFIKIDDEKLTGALYACNSFIPESLADSDELTDDQFTSMIKNLAWTGKEIDFRARWKSGKTSVGFWRGLLDGMAMEASRYKNRNFLDVILKLTSTEERFQHLLSPMEQTLKSMSEITSTSLKSLNDALSQMTAASTAITTISSKIVQDTSYKPPVFSPIANTQITAENVLVIFQSRNLHEIFISFLESFLNERPIDTNIKKVFLNPESSEEDKISSVLEWIMSSGEASESDILEMMDGIPMEDED